MQSGQRMLSASFWRAPPALRSAIARRAWLSQDDRILILASGCSIKGAHGGRLGFGRNSNRRFQSNITASTESSTGQSPRKRSRTARFLTTTAISLVLFSAAFAMSAAPAADAINGYANPPTDAETLHLYTPPTPGLAEINDTILNHPLALKLRSEPTMTESRPHLRIPPTMRPHNLTAGVLAGEGKLSVPPLNFNEKGAALPQMVQIMYLGSSVCGHPGIVHGGMLATMLDEGLARACFPALPNKIGVTASLKIDYRNPCPAGSYVVLKAYTTKVEGRKAWVHGWIELLGEEGEGEGTKIVEAEALFIEPRQAKNMARNIVASD
ncbi:hypothetical protein LTR37_020877 [Vermiconidia calcicola]|uniref:Uncharacterized protein n=1 Tax=Vermiconidia calcicola TaxID=1690605 RepID=A0ACC3MD23_9PEZI|nr:hypothetical protein LTR37_020877 [Vermiconidia calcicola]